MPNLENLDRQFRLQPWGLPEHDGYVTAHYGSLLSTPEAAEAYVQEYEKREKAADEAYELQRTLLRAGCVKVGDAPQELPDLVKLDWNPRKKFPQVQKELPKEAHVETVEEKIVKAEKKPAKEVKNVKRAGRPKKK